MYGSKTLHLSPKPNREISPHFSGGFCSRSTISCSSAELEDRLLQQQCTGCDTTTFRPQQLKTREMEICNMHFHIAPPVNAIFNAIDELMELAENSLMTMSSKQAVSLAYVCFPITPSYCRTSWFGIIAQISITHGRTWKCSSERHKRTCHCFSWHHIATLKQISLSLVESATTCHLLMIINPTTQLVHHSFWQAPLYRQQHSQIW